MAHFLEHGAKEKIFLRFSHLNLKNNLCQNVGTKENFLKIINLYRGNEIAVNSVTGRNLAFENLTIWREELETMRDLLGSLANVPAKDILGVRAPSLKVGRNAQYTVRILDI